MAKRFLKKLLRQFGYELRSIKINAKPENGLSMRGALIRCAQRSLNVNTVIDVGASNGSWSAMCMEVLPRANYFLIEAQDPHKSELDKFKSNNENVEYILAAAAHQAGKIYFDNSDLLGGLASETPLQGQSMEVRAITIDEEVKQRGLRPPYLIKLDTHGFEVPILEGAKETLNQSNLVIIETYNYKLRENSLLYHEMSAYMESRGFASIEMVDLLLRQRDHSLWQMDTFFVPASQKESNNVTYD